MKVVIYADGGSRGNPGVAGSGTVLYDATSQQVLREISYVVGTKATNNVAEYHSLINGLDAAIEMGAHEAEIYMDSKLVVEQMSGRWKIKHPDMQELAAQAKALVAQVGAVSFTWVPRAKNAAADALANAAMDAAAEGHPQGFLTGDKAGGKALEEDTNSPARWGHDDTPEAEQFTRFILLRHGQSEDSAQGRYSGRSNPELTSLGRSQAGAAARMLAGSPAVDAIITSPLIRARATAEIARQEYGQKYGSEVGEVIVDDRLLELDFGDFDGLTPAESERHDAQAHQHWRSDPNVAPPNGESMAALHERITDYRRELQAAYPGKTVLLVTHVNPIKSFVGQALDAGKTCFHHIFLDLASISIVEFRGDRGLVRGVNLQPDPPSW